MSFVFTLLGLGFVIFIHELGHLIAAKRANVGVTEFAVGMGPKIVSFNYGDTQYSLRVLPFGGFIKAKGLDDLEPCAIEEDFREKSLMDRATILAAGSFMNIVLGLVIFIIMSLFLGEQRLTPKVHQVFEGHPAQLQGMMVGDIITHINNKKVGNVEDDIIQFIKASKGAVIELSILRNGEEKTFQLSAEKSERNDYIIGVSFKPEHVRLGVFESIGVGFKRTGATIGQSFKGIKMLIMGQASVKDLAGPVGIVQIASSQIQKSMVSFFGLMAFISISLGVINLFPFPILDGGHLLFLAIEGVRGRPLNKKTELYINNTATIVLISLMAFIVFNDVISWDERVTIIQEMNK